MPDVPARPCPCGCGELVAGGCAGYRAAYERGRGKTAWRGYDGAHRRLRSAVLAEFPVCQVRLVCEGAVATDLDHIVPIAERPEWRLERSNVRSSCGPCNEARTSRKSRKSGEFRANAGVFVAL